MKNSIIILLFLCTLLASLTGCSSTMKCSVYGAPGTKIYTSDGQYLGSVGQSGECEVKINRKDKRHDFLLTQQMTESPIIPMGLDYNKRNNALRETFVTITTVPLLWIPAACLVNYYDRLDAEDKLALYKRQNSNQDLYSMVANASNPIDEIKSSSPKEHKSARITPQTTKRSKQSSTPTSSELNFNKNYIYYFPYEDKAYKFNADGTGIQIFDTSLVAECVNELSNSDVTVNSLPFSWKKKTAKIVTVTTLGDYPNTYDVTIVSSRKIKVNDTVYFLTDISELTDGE